MPHHRRIVLNLQHGSTNRRIAQAAAEMAHLMGLGLFGVFIEDESVVGLANMPFAREFRLLSHEWQPIDSERVTEEFRHAAMTAKRLLDEAAHGLGVTCAFEVRRGHPFDAVTKMLRASDIVVIAEPVTTGEELTRSFMRSWREAVRAEASVLLLPPGRARQRGPIVTLLTAATADAIGAQRGLQTAAHIARIGNEILIPLLTRDEQAVCDEVVRTAVSIGVPIDRIQVRVLNGVSEHGLSHALSGTNERMLVLQRGALAQEQEAVALRVATARATPVLLVGEAAEAGGSEEKAC